MGAQEPAAEEVSTALEPAHTGLRGRQADEVLRHEVAAELALFRRAGLDVPGGRDVDAQDGFRRLDDGGEYRVEGRAHGWVEAEAEEGVDDQVGGREGGGELLGRAEKGDVEVVQLLLEAREDGRVRRFRVVYAWIVAVVVEMARTHEAVAACRLRT